MKHTEERLNAIIKAVKDNLTSGPVCDSAMRCKGWRDYGGFLKSIDSQVMFCPFCGKERVWRESS